MKDPRSFIHLYRGCQVQHPNLDFSGKLESVDSLFARVESVNEHGHRVSQVFHLFGDNPKPRLVLRPLDSMLDKEKEDVYNAVFGANHQGAGPSGKLDVITDLLSLCQEVTSQEFADMVREGMSFSYWVALINWLRTHNFDCDNLIENGNATGL